MPKAPSQYRKDGQRSYAERERDRKADIDATRGSSAQRGYGYRWQQYRAQFLREHPLCVECEAEGRHVPATVVDHIRDHRGNHVLFWLPQNHRAVCKAHHDAKTARTVLNAAKL
jgi:5-methylcytosine-specific restriction endonuclease McrA